MDHVGTKIRELREAKGVKQNALARFADLSVTTMYQIERGERTPSLAALERIAAALDVHPSELFPKAPAPSTRPSDKEVPGSGAKPPPVTVDVDPLRGDMELAPITVPVPVKKLLHIRKLAKAGQSESVVEQVDEILAA